MVSRLLSCPVSVSYKIEKKKNNCSKQVLDQKLRMLDMQTFFQDVILLLLLAYYYPFLVFRFLNSYYFTPPDEGKSKRCWF